MPEYNVSKLKLPNGDILNLPGGSAATYYGTCNSAATDQIKSVVVSEDQNFNLRKGVLIGVFFYNTNLYNSTVANPVQLNVNSTGAKSIKYGEDSAGATTGTEPNAYGYENRIAYYMYDGTNWVWVSQGKDTLISLTSTASSTNETEAITPKGVYNTINNNTMSQSEAETGTSTTARTISAATLKAAIEEHSGAATEWLSETTVSSGSTETNGIEYTISTTNYKDGTTDTTYNNTFTVKNGTSSRPGVVYLTSTSADSSSASGTSDKTAATPLCVYNSIHDTDNALTLQNIGAGTDDTVAYTITASRLAYAVQAHDHLVDFKPAYTDPLVYDNTTKKLTLNADMDYYYRDSTGHPGGHDLDIESTGYLEVPYGDGTNPGLLKLSSAAATSSSESGNSDYTAATPKAVYDSIHSTSNVMPSATATAGTDTTMGYTLTAARLKEAIETFGGTTYDAIDGSTDFWGTPYASLSTDEKVISPKELAYFIEGASGRATSYRLPSNANLNDYTDCCHTYFCDTSSSNMTNLPSDVSCDGLKGYFNLIPINIAIFSKGQILIAEDKDYVYFRRYRQGAWTAWRALGIPCTGRSALGSVYLTDSAANVYSSGAAQSIAASPECVYNSIRSSDNAASTSEYGVTKLSSSTSSTSTTLAATPSAVRSAYNLADSAYDLADSKADKATTFSMNISSSISASDYQYSAVVSNGIVIINFRIQFSSAPTSDNYLKLFTGIPSSYRPPQGVPGSAMTSSCETKTIWVSSGGNILGALSNNGINAGGWLIGSVSYSYDSNNWVD